MQILFIVFITRAIEATSPCNEKYCVTCDRLRTEGRKVDVCERLLAQKNCCSIYLNGRGNDSILIRQKRHFCATNFMWAATRLLIGR